MKYALIFGLMTAMLSSSVLAQDTPSPLPPRPVVSEILTPLAARQQTWVGTVMARNETDLGFLQLGTLASRSVEPGDLVAEGQVLAQLDPQDLDAALRAAQAGVTVAEAQAQSARDASARANELVARGVDSTATAQSETAQLAAAEAQLEQARATLARAQDARDNAALHAPQDGVVTETYADPGEALAAGAPVLRLAGIAAREVVIDLSAEDVAGFTIGATFDARLESDPTQLAVVTLTTIEPVASQTTRTRRLRLALPAAAPTGFRLGTLVTVQPQVQSMSQITVPAAALMAGKDQTQVWRVVPPDRKVQPVTVILGPEIGDRLPVLEGLAEGDEIVVRGVNSLEDGQIVGPQVSP